MIYSYINSSKLSSIWFFIISLDIFFLWDCECTSPAEINVHLEKGMLLLAQGKAADALSHLHAAIDGDPNNFMSYYKRATVYLALGRSKMGLHDLESTLRFKPDFIAARIQKASILLKLGRLDEAYIELEKVLSKEQNEEAFRLMSVHNSLKEKILFVRSSLDGHYFDDALSVLKEAIEMSPWDPSLREMRFEILTRIGDVMGAISELRSVTKLTQDNTDAFYKLSSLYYQVGDVDMALGEIRECLKLDPDHKECFPFYKRVKKIGKLVSNAHNHFNEKDYEACVSSAEKVLKEESNEANIRFLAWDKVCQCGGEAGSSEKALKACAEALQINEEARIYCDRAEVHILKGDFDRAANDFNSAINLDENFPRAKEGISRAQKLKKQASKRDYYKILGVKRNASKKEISKAYRTLAQKWHPDHYDGDEKEEAEKMFLDIAAAKEVLTDEEKRAKFDAGEDPLDPEQNQGFPGGGFNPFQQFHFRPRGGGSGFPGGDDGQFHHKFNFN